MHFIAVQKHAAESCPKNNEQVKTLLEENWRKKDSHMPVGVRLKEAYAESLNHKIFLLFEASNIESVEQAVDALGFSKWGRVEIRHVEYLDDIIRKM